MLSASRSAWTFESFLMLRFVSRSTRSWMPTWSTVGERERSGIVNVVRVLGAIMCDVIVPRTAGGAGSFTRATPQRSCGIPQLRCGVARALSTGESSALWRYEFDLLPELLPEVLQVTLHRRRVTEHVLRHEAERRRVDLTVLGDRQRAAVAAGAGLDQVSPCSAERQLALVVGDARDEPVRRVGLDQ